MRRSIFFLLVLFLIALPLIFMNKKTVTIKFESGAEISAEVAESLSAQAKGLSNRVELADKTGMLFVYKDKAERIFWMKEMQFAIDIIWIKDGVIVGFELNALPADENADDYKIYSSPEPVDMVLEVQAGFVEREGIEVGERITQNPPEE